MLMKSKNYNFYKKLALETLESMLQEKTYSLMKINDEFLKGGIWNYPPQMINWLKPNPSKMDVFVDKKFQRGPKLVVGDLKTFKEAVCKFFPLAFIVWAQYGGFSEKLFKKLRYVPFHVYIFDEILKKL